MTYYHRSRARLFFRGRGISLFLNSEGALKELCFCDNVAYSSLEHGTLEGDKKVITGTRAN